MRNGDLAAWMAIVAGAVVSTTLSLSLLPPSSTDVGVDAAPTAARSEPAAPPVDDLWTSGERHTIDFAVIRGPGSTREVWAGPGADRFLWENLGAVPHRTLPGDLR